jgi:hypothetical protein
MNIIIYNLVKALFKLWLLKEYIVTTQNEVVLSKI